jgi:DNA-binding CsgD family transcriptional regulator
VIDLLMGTADVARVRFARSPMDELVHSLSVLAGRKGDGMHRRWVRMALPRLAGLDLSTLDALASGHGYDPDFLMPPPRTWDSSFPEELERVRAASADEVRRCLDVCFPDGSLPDVLRPLYDDPDTQLGHLAKLLAGYWTAAIEPVWERLCAVHEADLSYRSNLLTAGGVDRVFADLHPRVSYIGDRVRVQGSHPYRTYQVNGAGILLVPCVFIWPKLTVFEADNYQPALTYAARGVGDVWATPLDATETPVAELIGRGRASLLALLDLPQSTSQLAARLGVAPSTVSEHLSILRRSKLVRSHRSGRTVLYERTPLASLLLD